MICIFCQIASGEAPARIVYQDDLVTAFHDLHPAAAVHLLIIPNRHVATLDDLTPADDALVGRLFGVARRLAAEAGLAGRGWRLVINSGADAGQSVFHLHVHLLGGGRTRSHLGLG